jgi:Arc/MetJ family transcription regulator
VRTTVVLDDELVAEARAILGPETLRGLLELALREAIKARQRESLLQAITSGSLELDISDADLQRMRQDRSTVAEWITEGFTATTAAPSQ